MKILLRQWHFAFLPIPGTNSSSPRGKGKNSIVLRQGFLLTGGKPCYVWNSKGKGQFLFLGKSIHIYIFGLNNLNMLFSELILSQTHCRCFQ